MGPRVVDEGRLERVDELLLGVHDAPELAVAWLLEEEALAVQPQVERRGHLFMCLGLRCKEAETAERLRG